MSAALSLRFDDRTGGNVLSVPNDTLLRTRLLVQANSGGGKSHALRALLEQTHGRALQLVLDPEGEFATLREQFGFVLAGKEGDVPAHPKIARVLCRRLVETGASAVIDLYDLSLAERREFVKLFLTELMSLPRALWKPALVVLDEAHLFCPERGSGESQSTEAVIALCTQGRKRGFCAVLATQRISKLHKDAAAELLNKLIGRTGLDVDMKRAGDELGLDKDGRAQLRDLKPGEFFAFGPAMGGRVQRVRSADVLTRHPDSSTFGAIVPPASASVQALVAEIGDLPKLAVKEQDERVALEQRVRELQAQLRAAKSSSTAAAPDSAQLAAEYSRGIEVGRTISDERAKLAATGAQLHVLGRLTEVIRSMENEVTLHSTRLAKETAVPTAATVQRIQPVVEASHANTLLQKANTRLRTVARPEGVGGVQQKILDTLAGLAQLGVNAPDKATVAALCDYHPNAKSYANAMGALRTSGFVEYPAGGRVALTSDGTAIATPNMPVQSWDELHEMWYRKLGKVAERILRPLLDHYPNAVPAVHVAESAGYHPNAKSFANMRGRLKTLGLIAYPRPGHLVATDLLFPEGLS